MIGKTKEMIDIKGGWKETTALMEASDKAHGKIVELLLAKERMLMWEVISCILKDSKQLI